MLAMNDADLMNIVCSDITGPSPRTRHYGNHGNYGNHRAVGPSCPGGGSSTRRRSNRKDSEGSTDGQSCPRGGRRRSNREDSEGSGRKGSDTVRIRHYIDGIESSFLSQGTSNIKPSSAKSMRVVFGQIPNNFQSTGEKQRLRRRSSQQLPIVTFSPSSESPGRRGSLFVQSPSQDSPAGGRRGSLFIRSPSPSQDSPSSGRRGSLLVRSPSPVPQDQFATSTPVSGRTARSRSMYAWNGGDEGNKNMLFR
eukprot:sb/3468738/